MLLNILLLLTIGTIMSPSSILGELSNNMKERGAPDGCSISEFFKLEDMKHYGSHQHAYGHGKLDRALDHIRQIDDIDYLPAEMQASFLLEKANVERGQHQIESSIATIQEAQALFPEDKTFQLWCDLVIAEEMRYPCEANLMNSHIRIEKEDYQPQLSEVRSVFERIFENDDYDDPMRIYAHVCYAKHLISCGKMINNHPKYFDAAIEHIIRAKAIIAIVQQENPEWGSGFSPFNTRLRVIKGDIDQFVRKYGESRLDMDSYEIGSDEFGYDPLHAKPWDTVEREIIQQIAAEKAKITYPEMRKMFESFLKPHLGSVNHEAVIAQVTDMEQAAAYLAEVIMDPESDGYSKGDAIIFLAFTKTARAKETLLKLIENLRSIEDGALTKKQDLYLYYAVRFLGCTKDESVCEPLLEMTEDDYWEGLYVRLSNGRPIPSTYQLHRAALWSIAETGSQRAVEIFKTLEPSFKEDDQNMPYILKLLDKRREENLAEEKRD